jgi:general secretion pathway protein K
MFHSHCSVVKLQRGLLKARDEVTGNRSEEGIALIVVLWMLILLSIVAATLTLEIRSSTHVARNMAENAAARAAADAGIQRAILDLASSANVPTNEKFRTDGTVYAWQFANCAVRISIQDEASKIDLNQAPEELVAALFGSVGIDSAKAQSLAAAIVDFRDKDNWPRPYGAEETEYQAAGLAWGPKNAPFQTVEELQQVLGMTAEIYQRVAPNLTTYYVPDAINPTTTNEQLAKFLRRSNFNLQYFASSPGVVFSVSSEALGTGGVMSVREAVVQVDLQEKVPIVLLAWKE